METARVEAHQGAQSWFLKSLADIAIYGGARGGGKTFALLLEGARHVRLPEYRGVIFRRTYPRIMMAGSLWDTSQRLYHHLGGDAKQSPLGWTFGSGARVDFAHMQHPKDVKTWRGAQAAFIGLDQLEEFTEDQFWVLLGSNRSTCGIRPYIRATCNPDSESWLRQLIDWWIGEDGFPLPDRSGVLRYFARVDDEMIWGDTPDAVRAQAADAIPKSLTFIPALLHDNPTLMKENPEYLASLKALPHVEQERMLGGNWDIAPQVGMMFPRDKWEYCDKVPKGARWCRFWDKAATQGGKGARTAGPLLGVHEGRVYVADAVVGRWGEAEREAKIRATAELDRDTYGTVETGLEQEPGSGGKDSAMASVRNLAGFNVFIERATGAKADRWRPLASQQQAGNCWIVRGAWDWQDYVRELDQLSGDAKQDSGRLKDLADASAGAYQRIAGYYQATIPGDLLADDDLLSHEDDGELPEFLADIAGPAEVQGFQRFLDDL